MPGPSTGCMSNSDASVFKNRSRSQRGSVRAVSNTAVSSSSVNLRSDIALADQRAYINFLFRKARRGIAVKGQSIARALNDHLTEEGLKRIIARTSPYDRRYINRVSPEILGKNIAAGPRPRKMSRGGRVVARKTAAR